MSATAANVFTLLLGARDTGGDRGALTRHVGGRARQRAAGVLADRVRIASADEVDIQLVVRGPFVCLVLAQTWRFVDLVRNFVLRSSDGGRRDGAGRGRRNRWVLQHVRHSVDIVYHCAVRVVAAAVAEVTAPALLCIPAPRQANLERGAAHPVDEVAEGISGIDEKRSRHIRFRLANGEPRRVTTRRLDVGGKHNHLPRRIFDVLVVHSHLQVVHATCFARVGDAKLEVVVRLGDDVVTCLWARQARDELQLAAGHGITKPVTHRYDEVRLLSRYAAGYARTLGDAPAGIDHICLNPHEEGAVTKSSTHRLHQAHGAA